MAKFQEGKEKTIDEVIKELGLEEVHYDGDDFDEDPDKDFNDPYEDTYKRLRKNADKRDKYVYEPISKTTKSEAPTRNYKGKIDDEFDDDRNESFRIDLDIDAVNDIYEESKMKKEGRKSGAILNKMLTFGGIAVAVLFVIFILASNGVIGSASEEEIVETTETQTTKTNINVNVKNTPSDTDNEIEDLLNEDNNNSLNNNSSNDSNSSNSDSDIRVIKID